MKRTVKTPADAKQALGRRLRPHEMATLARAARTGKTVRVIHGHPNPKHPDYDKLRLVVEGEFLLDGRSTPRGEALTAFFGQPREVEPGVYRADGPRTVRPAGRAPRPATNPRVRGSRRVAATRSSARSGDSGDPDPAGEPPAGLRSGQLTPIGVILDRYVEDLRQRVEGTAR